MDYLNDEISHVATWIKANKLFIKEKKTKIMIFRTKQKFLATRLLKIGKTIIEDFRTFVSMAGFFTTAGRALKINVPNFH